ncbi:hypothetical protein WR25_24671 [Diploscapter pachys]|uniref:Uncharacterized protein n=1 Tax=Diploscapter pachys TaxID=2018661 RepID=A0A2A2LMS9_9BILA|nr:hypothetical protein WR25_24671 [Diploscapter pachys]
MIRACSRSRVTRMQEDKAEATGDMADRATTEEVEVTEAEETSTRICRAPTIRLNLISHSRTMDNSSIEGGSSIEAEAEVITMNGKDRDGEEMDKHKDMEEETGKTGEETISSSRDIRDRAEQDDSMYTAKDYVIPAMTCNPWAELERQRKREQVKQAEVAE